jgi:hypothetical protein
MLELLIDLVVGLVVLSQLSNLIHNGCLIKNYRKLITIIFLASCNAYCAFTKHGGTKQTS